MTPPADARLNTMTRAFLRAVFVVSLAFVAACGANSATGDGASGDDQTETSAPPTETVPRTVSEERPTTTKPVSTIQSAPLGPLPDPEWEDVEFVLQLVAEADEPTAMAVRTGSDDLWITEREGRVRLIQRRISLDERREGVKLMNTVVLDLTDKVSTNGEGGLLGLDFSSDGRFLYVSYTNNSGDTVIAEYQMGTITALASTERLLLEVDQPFSNHNGGQITLGPDGFLYVGLGDGGSANDPDDHGQNLETLLGSILRIDPAEPGEDTPYSVPGGNPFELRNDARDEIWLYGVRNPWRFSFDQENGDLWIGDVGQNSVEEITHLPSGGKLAGRGANLGWRITEGDEIFDDRGEDDPLKALRSYEPPLHTYGRDNGRCSVTGGYVYRGDRNRELRGVYLFADYCSGEVWGLRRLSDGRPVRSRLRFTGGVEGVASESDGFDGEIQRPVSFGQGPEGELYLLLAGGSIVRIEDGWRIHTEVLGPDETFRGGGFEQEVLPGDGDGSESDG